MNIFRGMGWAAGALVVLLLSFVVGGYFYLRSTVPEYDGTISVEGISGEVEIIRDSFGMPHIYGSSEEDVSLALGYCMAQDRLFQMEMIRRTVKGELSAASELLGKDMVLVDRLFKTITAVNPPDSMMTHLSDTLRSHLEAFSAGVNRYLLEDKPLPFEFALLGFKPDLWKPSDCLAVQYLMAWTLNFSFDTELTHAAIADRVGSDLANEIFIDYPDGGPSILTEGSFRAGGLQLLETIKLARQITGAPLRGASNNWVVSGSKSESGRPLLANDMHLGLMIPGIWYEAHLVAPGLNVSGVVLPGVPLVVAGANEHVAWGLTNVMADDADFYVEKINPDDSFQYEFRGQWESMTVVKDTIHVSGGEDVPIDIRITRHGAIIDDIIDSQLVIDGPIAMRWTRNDFNNEGEAIYRLNRAKSVDDIERAAAMYKCPGQNWVYADDAGNIGYWAAVGIPVRDGFDGRTLLPGADGDHEWMGFVPADGQPHVKNPEQGWIATANNKLTGDDYPYVISHAYAPPDRFDRIRRLLTEKDKLSVEDFKRIQADEYLVMAEVWVPKILAAMETRQLDGSAAEALAALSGWDFEGRIDGTAPAIFHVVLQNAVEMIFKERLGDTLYEHFIGGNVFTIHNALYNLLDHEASLWFDNPTTERIENFDTILVHSFADAVDYLTSELGEDVNSWHWGDLHNLTFYNPVGGRIPLIGGLMNIGPFPCGGGSNSVNAAIYRFGRPWRVVAGASQRHIFDLGNMKNSLRVIPTGLSGNFMSDHYDDQVEMWLNAEYRPFVLDRAEVERDAAYKLTLVPAAEAIVDNPSPSDKNNP